MKSGRRRRDKDLEVEGGVGQGDEWDGKCKKEPVGCRESGKRREEEGGEGHRLRRKAQREKEGGEGTDG